VKALALAVGLALALAACAPTTETAELPPPPAVAPAPAPPAEPVNVWASVVKSDRISCEGRATQGGFVVCRTAPGAMITVDGKTHTKADASGLAVVGFDRDAPALAQIDVQGSDFTAGVAIPVAPRAFSVQQVNGLPQNTVTPTDKALLARIAREVDVKNVGFASRADVEGFFGTWIWPVSGRVSGLWGNQRVLNGVPNRPHYGIDIAAPVGAEVRAPAGGVVALAEPDMFYEGGLVLLDHGQGLISMYLHMSRVDVKPGDVLKQGDLIGAVGAKGRATGPHLCWRMKWRDRYLDPSLMPTMEPVEAGATVVSLASR
jgi:murein DD-endopeptidase MepM/ murein hydrolase activator NlpD